MSKVNNSMIGSIGRFLKKANVTVLSYEELLQSPLFSETMRDQMETYQAFHNQELNLIAVDDQFLKDSTELVLHELVHMAIKNVGIVYSDTEEGRDTEDAAAQFGILKIVMNLNMNPALYEGMVFRYLKTLPEANFDKADRYSTLAVNNLMNQIKRKKAA